MAHAKVGRSESRMSLVPVERDEARVFENGEEEVSEHSGLHDGEEQAVEERRGGERLEVGEVDEGGDVYVEDEVEGHHGAPVEETPQLLHGGRGKERRESRD